MSKRYYIEGASGPVPMFEPTIDSKPLDFNFVSGPFRSVIDGHETPLAGCDQQRCDRRAMCLRADKKLASRAAVSPGQDACGSFIPVKRLTP